MAFPAAGEGLAAGDVTPAAAVVFVLDGAAAGDGENAAGDGDCAAGDGDCWVGDGDCAAGDGVGLAGDGERRAGEGDCPAGDGEDAAGDGDVPGTGVGLATGEVVLTPVATPATPAAFDDATGDGEAPVVLLPWPDAASAAAAAAAPAASDVVEVLVAGDEAGVVAAAAEAAVGLMPRDKEDGAFGDEELTPGDATAPGGVLTAGEMTATGDEPAPGDAATPGEEALALVLEAASAAAVAAAAAAVAAAGDVELVSGLLAEGEDPGGTEVKVASAKGEEDTPGDEAMPADGDDMAAATAAAASADDVPLEAAGEVRTEFAPGDATVPANVAVLGDADGDMDALKAVGEEPKAIGDDAGDDEAPGDAAGVAVVPRGLA